MNQPQPPFAFMPFPVGGWPAPQQQIKPDTDRLPKRVVVAVGLLHHFAHELSPQAMVNDVGMNEIEPRKLEIEERKVMAAACDLITQYLKGAYELTGIEQEDRKVEKRGRETMTTCFQCGGRRYINGTRCEWCEGSGHLVIRSATPEGD